MKPRKITVIREMTVGSDKGERRSFVEYDEDTGLVIRPDSRLSEKGREEWDDIMKALQKFKGGLLSKEKDLRYIIDGPALLDHCIKF